MSAASHAKKRAKKKELPAQTKSFDQMMAQSQVNALKPYINQQVAGAYNEIYKMVLGFNQSFLSRFSSIQNRMLAVENLLIQKGQISLEEIRNEITNIEDQALGYTSADVAQEGDLVRVELYSRVTGETDWGDADLIQIYSLLKKNETGEVQTLSEVEEALVGMGAGQEKEVVVPAQKLEAQEGQEEEKDTEVKILVKKVSRKVEPEAKKEEVSENA